jgi:hypothetical protein
MQKLVGSLNNMKASFKSCDLVTTVMMIIIIHQLPLRHLYELLEALLRGLWVWIEELDPVSKGRTWSYNLV